MPRVNKVIYNEVLKRDNFTCTDCRTSFPPGSKGVLVCHHVTPKNQGGATTPENLRAMCLPCHTKHHPKITNLYKKNFRVIDISPIGTIYERCY